MAKMIWAKQDMPIEKRVLQGVLFACKTLMASPEWGYSKTSIWVDLEKSTILLGSDTVVEMSILDRKLNVKTGSGYEAFVQDPGWQQILKDAQTKLSMVPTKGAGKNGKGGKGQKDKNF